MPAQRSPAKRNGPPSRQSQQGRGRGRGGGAGNLPHRQPPAKFKGNCSDLSGHVFDCSDYKQADTFVNTLKRISKYVGAEYKHGGDIQLSLFHELKIILTIPRAPFIVDPLKVTADKDVAKLIFKGELDSYIKRKAMLADNIQKTYSLVIG